MDLKIIDLLSFKNKSEPNIEFLTQAKNINREYSGSNVESFQKVLTSTKFFLPLQISETNTNGDIPVFTKAKRDGRNEKYTVVFTSYEEFEKFYDQYPTNEYKILVTDYNDMNKIIKLAGINGYIIDIYNTEIYIYHANI